MDTSQSIHCRKTIVNVGTMSEIMAVRGNRPESHAVFTSKGPARSVYPEPSLKKDTYAGDTTTHATAIEIQTTAAVLRDSP